jgi:hypothetical protein
MKTTLFALNIALCVAGCASGQHHSTTPNPEEAQSLDAYVRDMFDHIGRGDFAYMKASACPEAVVFDIDENGAPIAARGKAEIDRMIDRYQETTHAGGASTSANITRLECRSFGGSGVCAIEFDQSMTANGQTMGPFKLRATLVAERHRDRWIWVHWHASMREAPQQQAPAAAAPAAPPAAPAAPAAAPAQ